METYDIIVCGAGSAGFCAAVAAARMGAKTALVEKYNTPGGILTVLGNNSIDQFNNPFIADKKMVITGIGWELVLRLHKEGYARIPDMNAPRENHEQYGVKVNPVAAAKIMDDMLLNLPMFVSSKEMIRRRRLAVTLFPLSMQKTWRWLRLSLQLLRRLTPPLSSRQHLLL